MAHVGIYLNHFISLPMAPQVTLGIENANDAIKPQSVPAISPRFLAAQVLAAQGWGFRTV
jgi:hypothetical protein